jgi:flagellar biosynthesis protein FlhA
MGTDLTRQLIRQPRAIMIAASILILFGIVPGMPTTPFIMLGAIVGAIGYMTNENLKRKKLEDKKKESELQEEVAEERTEDLLKVDSLEVEIGYGLIPLVDVNQGGDLLDKVAAIRRQLAIDLGIIVPAIRIRDNVQLAPNQYRIKVKGIEVSSYDLMLDHIMAINPGYIESEPDGFGTTEPAYGLKATWIIPNLRETVESQGYTIVEPSAVLATHLTEVIKNYSADLLTRQDVKHLIDTLREDNPSLVEGVVPEVVPLSVIQKVLQALLVERICIRDMTTIMETVTDLYATTKEADVISEYVRMSLKRQITEMYKDDKNRITVFTIDPGIEQMLTESIQNTKQGLMLVTPPAESERLLQAVGQMIEKAESAGHTPICLSSPNIRLVLKRLVETSWPSLVVLSYNEISNNVEVNSIGLVRFENDN